MSSAKVEHFVKRADDFFDGMTSLRNDPSFQQSSALLAIHSAISFADALRTGLGDDKLASDDHRRAVQELQGLLTSKVPDTHGGLKHLSFLLSKKSLVSYGGKRLEHTDYEALFTRAERFAQWARSTASQLKIARWKYDS